MNERLEEDHQYLVEKRHSRGDTYEDCCDGDGGGVAASVKLVRSHDVYGL